MNCGQCSKYVVYLKILNYSQFWMLFYFTWTAIYAVRTEFWLQMCCIKSISWAVKMLFELPFSSTNAVTLRFVLRFMEYGRSLTAFVLHKMPFRHRNVVRMLLFLVICVETVVRSCSPCNTDFTKFCTEWFNYHCNYKSSYLCPDNFLLYT